MVAEQLWTGVARCRECGDELNRAEHVPTDKKWKVSMSAPFNAICKKAGHSTLSDLNYAFELEWTLEADQPFTQDADQQ